MNRRTALTTLAMLIGPFVGMSKGDDWPDNMKIVTGADVISPDITLSESSGNLVLIRTNGKKITIQFKEIFDALDPDIAEQIILDSDNTFPDTTFPVGPYIDRRLVEGAD